MPTKEEHLAKYTYKEDGLEVEKRVFYTLTGEPDTPNREQRQAHRNSKAVAQLFKVLLDNGTLTEGQLDDILLEVAL
jgi:hypothetical protein